MLRGGSRVAPGEGRGASAVSGGGRSSRSILAGRPASGDDARATTPRSISNAVVMHATRLCRLSGGEDPGFEREPHEVGSAREPELLHDPRAIGLDGLDAEPQLLGDL